MADACVWLPKYGKLTLGQMVDRLEAAEARGERLEKALKPIAAWMDALEPEFGDHEDDVIAGGVGDAVVRFGDLREARAALGFLVPDEES